MRVQAAKDDKSQWFRILLNSSSQKLHFCRISVDSISKRTLRQEDYTLCGLLRNEHKFTLFGKRFRALVGFLDFAKKNSRTICANCASNFFAKPED